MHGFATLPWFLLFARAFGSGSVFAWSIGLVYIAYDTARRRWFGGFLQTHLWYRHMVGNPSHGRLGTRMLPVKAFDIVQPIYGLTSIALLAGAAVGWVSFLTGQRRWGSQARPGPADPVFGPNVI